MNITEGTPIVNRLRPRKSQHDVDPDKMPENMSSKEDKIDLGAEHSGILEHLDSLHKNTEKHLESLQKNTERNLIEAMSEAMEKSKVEINTNIKEMISSLTLNVQEIKNNLKQVEDSFHKEINDVREFVKTVDQKVDNEIGKINRMEQDSKTVNTMTMERIKSLESNVSEASKKTNSMVSTVSNNLRMTAEQIDKRLHTQDQRLDNFINRMEDELDKIKVRSYGNSSELRLHSSQIESLDTQVRSQNIVVDGLAEKSDAETKEDLVKIVSKTIANFNGSKIKAIRRLGKLAKKRKRPRQVLVILADAGVRESPKQQR